MASAKDSTATTTKGSGSTGGAASGGGEETDPPNNKEDPEGEGVVGSIAGGACGGIGAAPICTQEEDLLLLSTSDESISVIYFTVGSDNHPESALVPVDAPTDDIKGKSITDWIFYVIFLN